MAALTICHDFGLIVFHQEEEICHRCPLFPFYLPCSNGLDAMILVFFLIFSLKPALLLSSFTLIKRLFSSFSLSAVRVVSPTYLKLLMFLSPVLIPARSSSRWRSSWCARLTGKQTAGQQTALPDSFLHLQPVSCCRWGSNCCS